MNVTNDVGDTFSNASTTFNTATDAINDIRQSTIEAINSAKDFINSTSNNTDDLCASANTFISSTDKKLDKMSNKVNNFIDEQQEEIKKTEKLLQIVFIALACLAVVGIIALIWNSIAKSRKQKRQNEILEQISDNIKNSNAEYNAKIGFIHSV